MKKLTGFCVGFGTHDEGDGYMEEYNLYFEDLAFADKLLDKIIDELLEIAKNHD